MVLIAMRIFMVFDVLVNNLQISDANEYTVIALEIQSL